MNSTTIVNVILGLAAAFFGKNPTVQEVEVLLPQIMTAITNAKTGEAFSVSFPESIDGKAGTSNFGWTPTGV